LKGSSRWLLILSFVWAITLLVLGGWWLYLLISFGEKLEELKAALGEDYDGIIKEGPNLANLVKWEGGTFLVLLSLLSFTMLFLYLKDQKKTKALQDFFAALTHELKTPLASIRLQAEVIGEMTAPLVPKARDLTMRMVEDVTTLETQMDKLLQLSRLERGGSFNLTTVDFIPYLENFFQTHGRGLKFKSLQQQNDVVVLADEFALSLILKNLVENTHSHVGEEASVDLNISLDGDFVVLNYSDKGQFTGDPERLSEMFYKHASSQGTGIGLYLVKKSLEAMDGQLQLKTNPHFEVIIKLRRGAAE
jgi:signal transduction histidine kinase